MLALTFTASLASLGISCTTVTQGIQTLMPFYIVTIALCLWLMVPNIYLTLRIRKLIKEKY